MRARLLLAVLLVGSTMLSLLDTRAAQGAPSFQTADPGTPGSRAVATGSYDGGDAFFRPSGWSGGIEFRGRFYHPTNLSGGPFPLIFLLHGNHGTCFSSSGQIQTVWPCAAGFQFLPNFRGYEYLGEHLASQGFIVVSISANGISGRSDFESSDDGMAARAELLLSHLQLWASWNNTTTGTFGNRFTGRVDLSNVGMMGHSRGGEGIARAYLLNAAVGRPFGIRALLPLAPTNFTRPVINEVPMAVILPYCDGDVLDLQGVHYVDDARYNLASDPSSKYNILVFGANHNFYNTVWTPNSTIPGGFDDWLNREAEITGPDTDGACNPSAAGNQRLTAEQQRATGIAYHSAFFRTHLLRERNFAPILLGDAPTPASAGGATVLVSYHAPNLPETRRVVNRFTAPSHATSNDLGGAVTSTGLESLVMCGGADPLPRFCLPFTRVDRFTGEPHVSISKHANTLRGPGMVSLRWQGPANFVNAIPQASADVSTFARLQFRVSTVWQTPFNPPGAGQSFSVVLVDSAGRSASVLAKDHSVALYDPPGSLFPILPKTLLNMIRIPLSAFKGVNLHDIRFVELRFDQTPSGWILLNDLAFTNPVPAGTPRISNISPGAAAGNATVVISGEQVSAASAVKFNGTEASFTQISTTQINATVPLGATSGPISVTTPGGTATSPGPFNVLVESVGVQVGRQPGAPGLTATFTARPSCGAISSIQFGNSGAPFNNARLSVAAPGGGPGGQTAGFPYGPPAGTTSVTVVIERVTPSGGATVTPIHIADGCGIWQTFVGGGPSAFE